MTLNSIIPKYRKEAASIDASDLDKAKVVSLAQKAFIDGVSSMIKVKSSKSADANKDLNESMSDYFLDKSFDDLYSYAVVAINDCLTSDNKLKLNYDEMLKESFKEIFKTVYDLGIINGVTIGQDDKLLAAYIKNKEMIESGKY